MYKKYFKQIIDFFLALFGLIILFPLFILVTVLLMIANKGEPFFFQKRPGKNTVVFHIVKFKTMNNKKDSLGNLLPDGQRITKIGSFIRKTSIDEIPQLLNVIKGDMSLVGPRPLLCEYLPLYNSFQMRRFGVKPGISGLAQINGRNAITWEDRFKYDVDYVDRVSFLLDMKILWGTIKKVVIREGISSSNSATMEKFTGS